MKPNTPYAAHIGHSGSVSTRYTTNQIYQEYFSVYTMNKFRYM